MATRSNSIILLAYYPASGDQEGCWWTFWLACSLIRVGYELDFTVKGTLKRSINVISTRNDQGLKEGIMRPILSLRWIVYWVLVSENPISYVISSKYEFWTVQEKIQTRKSGRCLNNSKRGKNNFLPSKPTPAFISSSPYARRSSHEIHSHTSHFSGSSNYR